MNRLTIVIGLFAFACRTVTAHAQTPPQFCMSQPAAQSVAASLQAAVAAYALMQDAVAEPQRQAAAVAAAVAKQKADDEAKPAPPKP